ncbi:SRPBCC family protein [Patulibacter sp.]|uniref:SRPBCC family protein n=1 Tax=Patulibacter sp. TaxID=1912859 RepID=UPI00272244DF|nr:SRPBCC family protein [Patulibacter sp.]MDO9408690.1 SRPBCC family protein [Patulibacter sp.]
MDPVTSTVSISRPREEVFAYLSDIANHRRFLDGRLTSWHLTREDSIGLGAGVRVKAKLPLNRFSYFDVTFTEVEPPYRIAMVGRGGKYDRTLVLGEITIRDDGPHGSTVAWTIETETSMPSDGIMETVGLQKTLARRGLKKGLERLRAILEDGAEGSAPVTIAGGARKPATGFRLPQELADQAHPVDGSRAHASS